MLTKKDYLEDLQIAVRSYLCKEGRSFDVADLVATKMAEKANAFDAMQIKELRDMYIQWSLEL